LSASPWFFESATSANTFDAGTKLSRLIQNYGDVFSLGCWCQVFGIELGQEGVKIAACEGPFERDAVLS